MVDSAAVVPAPIGLGGIINKLTTDPSAEIPAVSPAAIIRSITTDPAAEIPVVNPAGVINSLEIGADTQTPVVNPQGEINNLLLSPIAVPPNVDLTGEITEINKNFTEPIPLAGRIDAELNPVSIPSFNTSLTFTPDFRGITDAIKKIVDEVNDALAGALGERDQDDSLDEKGFVDTKNRRRRET